MSLKLNYLLGYAEGVFLPNFSWQCANIMEGKLINDLVRYQKKFFEAKLRPDGNI